MGANTSTYQTPFHSSLTEADGKKNSRISAVRVLATLIYWQCFVWFYDMSGYLACSSSKVATALTRGKPKSYMQCFPECDSIQIRLCQRSNAGIITQNMKLYSFHLYQFLHPSLLNYSRLQHTHRVQREFKLAAYTRRAKIFGFRFTGIAAGSQSG